jgi:DNA-binding MarR family transcriptional regulator
MAKKRRITTQRSAQNAYVGRVQDLVCRLAQLMDRCNEMCLAELDVTVSQGYTIMSLPQEGELTMNALSQTIGVAGSTATRMVDQLVRKDLVARRNDPDDRRVVRVALTQRGQELRRKVGQATDTCFMGAFAEVPEERRRGTIDALELITESFARSLEEYGCEEEKSE